MPVPTETFWNIKKLNLVFLASAGVLAAATMVFIVADSKRDWQGYQRQGQVWETALTEDALAHAQDAETRRQLDDLKMQVRELEAQLPHEQIAKLEKELADATTGKERIKLPMAVKKGELGPQLQQVERAILTFGENSEQAQAQRDKLAAIQQAFDQFAAEMSGYELTLAHHPVKLRELRAQVTEAQKQIANLNRSVSALEEQLKRVNPGSQGLAAKFSDEVRNAPLLDWFNPSLKVKQVVAPDIKTDFIFAKVETIDRCNTCHVNIDNPAFESSNLTAFVERQLALYGKQRLDDIADAQPVVNLNFWRQAAQAAGVSTARALAQLDEKTLAQLNEMREAAQRQPVESIAQLPPALERILTEEVGTDSAPRAQWYGLVSYYVADVKEMLRRQLGDDEFRNLTDLYRTTAITQLNEHRRAEGLKELSASPVMLGHPKIDLFVSTDSTHPMMSMGCTVCHEGSGQETDFNHVAHTPRDMWVDAKTGMPVPAPLLGGRTGTATEIARLVRQSQRADAPAQVDAADASGHATAGAQETAAAGATGHAQAHGEGHGYEGYSHADVNLVDVHNPAPFAPRHPAHGAGAYQHPADAPGTLRLAIPQSQYWEQTYHWHAVTYMHWEKPMHSLDYVESSCIKCHTEVYDIPEAAPKLFEGRQLFAQLGCANCHAVEDLAHAPDVKKVGPSLMHVGDKLSTEMMASWIWSPRGFRPTTRMPHYFMLENNSAPADILRTQVEVAAMSHYLSNPPTAAGASGDKADDYQPAALPENGKGNPEQGKALFAALGCYACHTNLAEQGEQWITTDLQQREGLDAEHAKARYAAMDYNQQHWYVQQYLEDKLNLVGPELSGVGTKLKAGRTEAQATQWLFDWLKNPSHYSSYTIMPSFRLDDQQALDMAAYLLALERPGYTPRNFDAIVTSTDGSEMLVKLVAQLSAGQMTPDMAMDFVRQNMDQQQQLAYLGQKMISHYGCNGCHLIPGFENAPSACTNLDGWGAKDPHKIDHGYFDHAFYKQHDRPLPVFKVEHEGLTANAVQISHDAGAAPAVSGTESKAHEAAAAPAGDAPAIEERQLAWEELPGDRRSWLYHKLHNPRMFDRGRESLQGSLAGGIDPGRPYDKLKMPKFFVNDRQARALVTYVTSLREALVSPALQARTYTDAKRRLAHGRAIATVYNCYGCHNVEGNEVPIQQYFGVRNPDGTLNDNNLNWAPPRLIGQGSKTQPQWLHHFLQNVEPIRPWLQVRMPSFPLTGAQATLLVDYFAGHSQVLQDSVGVDLAAARTIIDAADQRIKDKDAEIANMTARAAAAKEAGRDADAERLTRFIAAAELEKQNLIERRADWYQANTPPIQRLRQFAIKADLATADQLSARTSDKDALRTKWQQVIDGIGILVDAFQTDYPYVDQWRPQVTDVDMVRGEQLFALMGCMAGECHRAGDEHLLAEHNLLVKTQPIGNAGGAAAAEEEDPYGDAPAKKDDKKEDDGYGSDDGYGDDSDAEGGAKLVSIAPQLPPAGAPNLSLVADRLQQRWVLRWLNHARVMQPATRMQEFWPNGDSFFKVFPPDMRQEKEALFGYTGAQQKDTLVNFLYQIGPRNLTYNVDGSRLGPGAAPKVELTALTPPPAVVEQREAEAQQAAAAPAAPAAPAVSAEEEARKAAAAVAEPQASTIKLPQGDSEAGEGTRVVGVVSFDGKASRPRPIRMTADPTCDRFYKETGGKAMANEFMVNDQNQFQNVFVYVKAGLPDSAKTVPGEPAVIDQLGCLYRPHVTGVVVGQPLQILNSDPTLHNVKMSSKANGSFNDGMPVKGMVLNKSLSKTELNVHLKCDVHAWMTGVVHVVDNPFFAVTDVEGRYEIKGLPPGKYTLEAVHENERIKPVQFEVEVKADTSVRADATLSR